MDLSAGSAAFSQIVGLLGQFVGERRAKKAHDYAEFKAWLAENRHEDIIKRLEQNANTITSIKAVLGQDRAILLHHLASLDRNFAVVASLMQGFAGLAEAIRPDARLSEQALAFLRNFDRSGAGKVMEITTMSGQHLLPFEFDSGSREEIKYDDPRFFEDDVRQLVEIGLLRLDHDGRGHRVFHLTRQASALIQWLDRSQLDSQTSRAWPAMARHL